jgi:hypothetical protein
VLPKKKKKFLLEVQSINKSIDLPIYPQFSLPYNRIFTNIMGIINYGSTWNEWGGKCSSLGKTEDNK